MKILKAFLSFVIMALMLCCIPLSVGALTIYDGDFGYEVDTYTHTATLVDYKGTDAEVHIPEYYRTYPVAVIAKSAFTGNNTAEKIYIPSTTTTLSEGAFSYCSALRELTVPSTVTNVGTNLCMDCYSLQKVVYESGTVVASGAFAGCISLNEVTLSDNITRLNTGAFSRCTSLSDISFARNVTSFGDSVFYGSAFTKVEIPDGVTTLPYYSFAYSDTPSKVLIPQTVTEIHPNAFTGSDNVVIYCYTDSAAHQFAEEYSIPYVLLDGPGYYLGDVDTNNAVEIIDATYLQRHLALVSIPEECVILHGDVDGDGEITIIDATIIRRFIADFDVDFPVGEWIAE